MSTVDLLAGSNLSDAWRTTFLDDPSKPRLRDSDGDWVTAGELDARIDDASGRLRAAGIARGDRVVVSAAASVDLVVAYCGALRLGAIVVPMNTAYREREVSHIVEDAEPKAAILDDPSRVELPVVTTPDLRALRSSGTARAELTTDDPALICYTSGTTGAPKGAVLSHGNLLAGARSVIHAWRWTSQDRLLLALPLFHMHGLGVGLHGTLLAGASAVLYPRFDADALLQAIRPKDATMLFGVPTMWSRLVASPHAPELARLRLCVSGSAPLPPDLFARIEAAAGRRVVERYGMTETMMNTSNPCDGERRAGTVGLPLPGVEVRLAGDGEICLKGPNVFGGYWRNPVATAESFDSDGWFRTGDVGELDADGYLRIVGRTKELIISGGYNVYPREVEEVLREHPGVQDVAVAGTPDEEWGEIVTAFVVGAADPDDLLSFAAERLAPYKRPRLVRFVDELPRNALGKVLRDRLGT